MKKFIPFGQFAPDSDGYNPEFSAKILNVVPMVDGYESITVTPTWASDLAGVPVGAKFLSNGSILAGEDSILYIDSTNITGATGANITNGYYWTILEYGAIGIFIGKGNNPYKTTDYVGSAAVALGGSPPQAACGDVVREFVVLGDIGASNPNRVQWSGFGDAEEWTPGTNQSDFQDLKSENGDVMAVVGGEEGTIFQENAITRMTYVGAPLIFEFDQISSVGTAHPKSVVKVDNDIYYLAQDGFKVLRNGINPEPIGVNRVDKQAVSNVVGAYDRRRNYVVWLIGSSNLLIYKIDLDRWAEIGVSIGTVFLTEGLDNFIFWDAIDNKSHIIQHSVPISAGVEPSTETILLRTGIHDFGQTVMIKSVRPIHRGKRPTVLGAGNELEVVKVYYDFNLSKLPTDVLGNSTSFTIDYVGDSDIDPTAYIRATGRYFIFEIQTQNLGFIHGFEVEFVNRGSRSKDYYEAIP